MQSVTDFAVFITIVTNIVRAIFVYSDMNIALKSLLTP
jgi:hypothetical protein